ncbi:hypothetical protein M407DRAFT_21529 [Tulasnella calospora MUT 4182]|uniref:F-box domain-containing protein n=1 Tax=Tulasnella calospora MUT 4182 TaxID=1051891 RepID=A0A0C3QE02_9AGAM|nr:hypothetical protein M407DRAFT_21529 [Tulasnella calospora MUT 4182]
MSPTSLDALPTDLLTLIAVDLAAQHPRGPPASVYTNLLSTSRPIRATSSPHLSSLVFQVQFDVQAVKRRLHGRVTPTALDQELQRRWKSLKRIRWAASAGPSVWGNRYDLASIVEDMWVAYLCLIENDGKNWEQLVGWAMLPAYIQAYAQWDLVPASNGDELPEEKEVRSLGLWLLWFLSDQRNTLREVDRYPHLRKLFIAFSFASYAYANAHHPWYVFAPPSLVHPTDSEPGSANLDDLLPIRPRPLTPRPRVQDASSTFQSYMSSPLRIAPPLASEAALHLFFARIFPYPATASVNLGASSSASEAGDPVNPLWDSTRHDAEWARLTASWSASPASIRSMPAAGFAYVPGSLTGIFEGTFVLPDLDTFRKVSAGNVAPMPTYDGAFIPPHTQAWRLEEHHCPASSRDQPHPNEAALMAWNRSASNDPRRKKATSTRPFRHGPALRAHLPENLKLERIPDGLLVTVAEETVLYRTWQPSFNSDSAVEPDDDSDEYIEIIVTGEAIEPLQGLQMPTMMHPGSSLRGTIRRKDGLITMWVVPRDTQSGQWLYIGHLTDGGSTWIGRWRSLQEDARSLVWEGLFRMQRR